MDDETRQTTDRLYDLVMEEVEEKGFANGMKYLIEYVQEHLDENKMVNGEHLAVYATEKLIEFFPKMVTRRMEQQALRKKLEGLESGTVHEVGA